MGRAARRRIDGQPEELNTSDYTLQVSDDGQTFSDLDAVTGNLSELTDRPASAKARFVRLRYPRDAAGRRRAGQDR